MTVWPPAESSSFARWMLTHAHKHGCVRASEMDRRLGASISGHGGKLVKLGLMTKRKFDGMRVEYLLTAKGVKHVEALGFSPVYAPPAIAHRSNVTDSPSRNLDGVMKAVRYIHEAKAALLSVKVVTDSDRIAMEKAVSELRDVMRVKVADVADVRPCVSIGSLPEFVTCTDESGRQVQVPISRATLGQYAEHVALQAERAERFMRLSREQTKILESLRSAGNSSDSLVVDMVVTEEEVNV